MRKKHGVKRSDWSEVFNFSTKKEAESYIMDVNPRYVNKSRYEIGRPNPLALPRGEGLMPVHGWSVFYVPKKKDIAWKKRR